MNFTAVNVLAILVVGVAYMVVGFLWYGPLFAKPWMKLVGMTQEDLQRGANSAVPGWASSPGLALSRPRSAQTTSSVGAR